MPMSPGRFRTARPPGSDPATREAAARRGPDHRRLAGERIPATTAVVIFQVGRTSPSPASALESDNADAGGSNRHAHPLDPPR
jgi:hypothetical protein